MTNNETQQPATKGLHNCRVPGPHNFWASLFTFVTGDRSQLVGLNISLRFIFKPSYSGNCANPNVGSNALD